MSAGCSRREQFGRYLIAGAINTVLTYVLLTIAMHWVAYLIAYTLVYALGIALGYWLQSRFVFSVPIDWRIAVRFPLVYLVQYVLGFILLWVLIDSIGVDPSWAALIVVIGTVPVGFLLSQLLLTHDVDRIRSNRLG